MVQSRTAPTVRFSAKKNLNLQFKFDQNCLFLRIPSSIRVRVAERHATNVPNRVRVAERHATNVPNATTSTIVLYKVQLQVQFVMIYIQSIIKYTNFIHIVINVLELAFQSHEGVGTEDLYLSQTLDHGRHL